MTEQQQPNQLNLTTMIANARAVFSAPELPAGDQKALPILGVSRQRVFFGWSKHDMDSLSASDKAVTIITVIASCQSMEDNIGKWECFVLTMFALLYPHFNDVFVKIGASLTEIPTAYTPSVVTIVDKAMEVYDKPDELSPLLQSIEPIKALPNWIDSGGAYHPTLEHYNASSEEALYGFLSLLVFLMGKTITDVNRTSLNVNRTRAIVERNRLQSEDYYLRGPGKMSNMAVSMIQRFWTTANPYREAVVDFCIEISTSQRLQDNIIQNTFHLLQWSQMAHARFIQQLLEDLSWVISCDYLRASFVHYITSLDAILKLPSRRRPFLKLIQGDKMTIFNRKALAPLLACALIWLKRSNPTLENYQKPEDQEDVEAKFKADLKAHGYEDKQT